MRLQKQKCARNRQVHERTAIKHSYITTSVAAVGMFIALWALGTFGVGHLFGVI